MSAVIFATLAALLALAFLPVLIKWHNKRTKFIKLINAIPGPKTYPIIGTTYLFAGINRKDLYEHLTKLKARYPDITRSWFGPLGTVELKRAEHIEKVLTSGKLHLQKAFIYKFARYWLGDGLLTADGEKWFSHRKIITPTFHFSILESFCEIFAEKSQILVKKLTNQAATGETFDIYPLLTRATLDIIAEAAMGTEINAQDDLENEYVKTVYAATELIARRMVRPLYYPDIIYRLFPEGRQFGKCLNILHGFTEDVIRTRKANRKTDKPANMTTNDIHIGKKKRLAFLDLLLETTDNGNPLTDEELREEVDTFMFEGHDTTTTGIAWTLFMLGLHPQIQEDVYNELEEIFQGSDRVATIPDFSDMKLLDRVIKETLRLYPPVPLIGRTTSEDIQIDQYTIPAGCDLHIEIYNLHKDERYFPDAQRFDPDRFLPENTENRHPYAYIPFSAGARNCIGQKFAVYEEKSVLSSIIRNYRFKTVGTREDKKRALELVLRPVGGVFLTLEKRSR